MGILGKVAKLAMDVVEVPIAVVKDTITLGGALIDKDSATVKKLKDVGQDWQEIKEKISEDK